MKIVKKKWSIISEINQKFINYQSISDSLPKKSKKYKSPNFDSAFQLTNNMNLRNRAP